MVVWENLFEILARLRNSGCSEVVINSDTGASCVFYNFMRVEFINGKEIML